MHVTRTGWLSSPPKAYQVSPTTAYTILGKSNQINTGWSLMLTSTSACMHTCDAPSCGLVSHKISNIKLS